MGLSISKSIVGAHGEFIKLVSEEKYGEVLGVHIIGPQATELIAQATMALQLEALELARKGNLPTFTL